MVTGIGVDIISVERFARAFDGKPVRLRRVFTEQELNDCQAGPSTWQRLAARFAAKEAVMKSLGAGIWQISFLDISVGRESSGRPCVSLSGNAEAAARRLGVTTVLISMSHEKTHAIAYATALAGED